MCLFNLTRVTEFTQAIISGYIKNGDLAIDATMGNGNDTLFLSKMVGVEGRVVSFDIQQEALERTRILLQNNNIERAVTLVHDSHEHIDKYVCEKIACVMFNLGYLPGSNHSLTTMGRSTITALEKCLKLLKTNGIITLAIYWGHAEGVEEKASILEYANKLEPTKYHVMKMEYINQQNNPPFIVAIVKK